MKASFTPAAAPPSPPSSARRRGVVTYATAKEEGNVELIGAMDKLIDRIDKMPDSFEAVAAFGQAPLTRLERWTRDLEKCFAALPENGALTQEKMLEIEKLGLARVEIMGELSLYLGAASEAQRRYHEEYIPQFTKAWRESLDTEDEIALKDVICRQNELKDRVFLFESTRATSVMTAQFLRHALETGDSSCAQERFMQHIAPMLENWRHERAGTGIYAQGRFEDVSLTKKIRIGKPLRFKQAVAA